MSYRPAIHHWLCARLGHRWGDLELPGGARGFRRRHTITLERTCERCELTERHTAHESVAGTNARPPGW